MLSLDSPQWKQLQHAYGSAADTPELLRQLETFPSSQGESEPWFSIWSSLAHQGDVYSASFAAVPHVIRVLTIDPTKASEDYFHFPAWVEICRYRKGMTVPDDLLPAYLEGLNKLPQLAAVSASRDWSGSMAVSALAAIAVSKKFHEFGEAILEMTPETVIQFRSWLASQ